MGERLRWFELAARQHKSLQEIQSETTSSEFVEWCVFYDEHWVDIDDLQYYLARIALYTFLPTAKEGWRGKLADFYKPKPQKVEESTPESRAEYAQRSKSIWTGWITHLWENRKVKNDGRP